MHRNWSRMIVCLCALSAGAATADDVAQTDSAAIAEILIYPDISRLDSIKNPADVKIMHLAEFADDEVAIDDQVLEKLTRFEGIRTLVLACPRMTDHGLKHVGTMKNLECLIIYDSQITNAGLLELKTLPNLQTLGLCHTAVTPEGVAKLKESLGATYVERYSSTKNGMIFDVNGCLRSRVRVKHFTLQDPARRK